MKLVLKSHEKPAVFSEVENYLTACSLKITNKDADRPWGGFFVLDEEQAQHFGKLFFPEVELSTLRISGKLSPKAIAPAMP